MPFGDATPRTEMMAVPMRRRLTTELGHEERVGRAPRPMTHELACTTA
jgi:hypothetical protein